MKHPQECRPNELEALFSLPESSEACQRIERHLDQCQACQDRLQELAADSAFWESTKVKLDESLDPRPEGSHYHRSWHPAVQSEESQKK